jgi:hypothetical protein
MCSRCEEADERIKNIYNTVYNKGYNNGYNKGFTTGLLFSVICFSVSHIVFYKLYTK